MRALVLSDSHGNTASIERAVSAVGEKNIDMIIFLGDIGRDADYIEMLYYPIKVVSVLGNNDFFRHGDYERIIDFDGHKIFICHGHTQSVNYGLEKLETTARGKGCVAALYGHTHQNKLEKREDGFFILNPGSTSRPRGTKASYAVLESEEGKLSAVVVDWVL